jgi:type III secretion protein N (ATPase)
VLLLADSITRFARGPARAGLSALEPPVRRGYPPSVFAELPRLFERAGNDAHGSITAFYTVLAEDDDNSDPVAEEVRSILDGHIVLSRKLAQAQHYPAIDVLAARAASSRASPPAHREAAASCARCWQRHAEVEFLLRVGEYQPAATRLADAANRAHARAEGAPAAALRRSDGLRDDHCALEEAVGHESNRAAP